MSGKQEPISLAVPAELSVRIFDRFALDFGSAPWAELPESTRQAFVATMSQGRPEARQGDSGGGRSGLAEVGGANQGRFGPVPLGAGLDVEDVGLDGVPEIGAELAEQAVDLRSSPRSQRR